MSGLILKTSRHNIYKIASLVFICVAIASVFAWLHHAPNASADGYTWISSNLSAKTSSYTYGAPTGYRQACENKTVTVGGGLSTMTGTACVYKAKSFDIAYMSYCDPNWYGGCTTHKWMLISFSTDKHMYIVNNLSTGSGSYCWYVSEQSDNIVNQCNGHLFIINDFLSHVTQTTGTTGTEYNYDSSKSDILDSNGSGVKINAANISNDGSWIVAEAVDYGLIRVNVTSHEITLFTKKTSSYGRGLDPSYELAITNDGQYVADGGGNVNSELYQVDDNCGHTGPVLQLDWKKSSKADSNFSECPNINLGNQLAPLGNGAGFREAEYPNFSDDGGRLRIVYIPRDSSISPALWVTLSADGYGGPQLDYLALGDSISSGEGDTAQDPASGQKYYRIHTNTEEDRSSGIPREKCHLSTRSYPYHLAASMELPSWKWNSVACSGAKTTDIYNADAATYDGQEKGANKPFPWIDGSTPRLKGYDNEDTLQADALDEFVPGRDEQIKFVEKYQPKAITVTVSANDIGFSAKLLSCIAYSTTCDWADSQKHSLAKQIQGEYDKLLNLFQTLHQKDLGARIYVIGYAYLISKDDPAHCGWNIGSLNDTERKMIVDATDYLNEVIERAANAAGVKYIDVSDALDGGRLCDDGQEYVNGIAFSGDNELQESFHPNNTGQAHIALAIEQATDFESLETYDVCQDTSDPNDTNCPQTGSGSEEPPITDFDGVLSDDEANSQNKQIIDNIVEKNSQHTFTSSEYTGKPGTGGNKSIHSDPVDLGSYTVAADGSIDTTITIPDTVPAGYHTLILTGQSYSGEPMEITQTILVTGDNPNDLDDNGVDDSQQPCGPFYASSGQDADLDGIDDACDPEISSSPQLYRLRVGDASRTYDGAPEHEDYLYVERNTRASAITGITDDYDPDGDGWAIVGVSQGIPYTTSTVPDTAPAANFKVMGDGMNAKPYLYIRAGGYGCISFTPTSLAQVEVGQSRTIKKVDYNTDQCRQEDPSDDVDGNGQSDSTQPLYEAHQGDSAKGEDPSRIYLYRNFYASEAQLGISDYTPSGTPAGHPDQPIQEWNLLASSKPNVYIPAFNKLVILGTDNPANTTGSPLPTILTKKQNGQCIAYQPYNIDIIKMSTQGSRYLTKLTNLPEGVECE